ncbi:39S ribosomal protein L51, mitochondrial [Lambiella insularis]|nr:39S ribosomal protein L51, mitochondrial [Lambiella insularis]
MNEFLTHNLPAFTRSSPTTEIHVSPRPHTHPVIRAHYIAPTPTSPSTFSPPSLSSSANTVTKAICVRNLSKEQIQQKAELLLYGNGAKNRRVKGGRVVSSLNESVRGVWSPMHGVGSPLEGLSRKG